MGASKRHTFELALAHGRNIDSADVIALLREVYAEGIGTRDEADELIAFDHTLAETTPDWRVFFATTIADHLLQRSEPAATLDENKAEWLISALCRGRRVATASGFSAVMRLLEVAPQSPSFLAAYAIDQLRVAVIAGDGPALNKRPHFSRMVDAEDVAMLVRILLAAGGVSGVPVSRAEAEALFDLHDAVAGGANDPGFDDLFFKAIAHHLLAGVGVAVPARHEMLQSEPELARRLAPTDSRSLLGPDESAWLAGRIMRDGRATRAEFLLLQLFSGEPDDANPTSRRSLDHAA
jgi:hypothetical protein